MNHRTVIAITIAAATILAYAAFGQQTQPPVTLILDGQPVASLSNFDYDATNRHLKLDTVEVLYDCQRSLIHSDRFENAKR